MSLFWLFFQKLPNFFSRIFVMRNKGRDLCFGKNRNWKTALRGWEICVHLGKSAVSNLPKVSTYESFLGYFCKNYPIFVMRNQGRHLCFGRDRNLVVESEIALWGWHICAVSISPRNLFLTSWVLKSTMGWEMHQNSMNYEVAFMWQNHEKRNIGLMKYLTKSRNSEYLLFFITSCICPAKLDFWLPINIVKETIVLCEFNCWQFFENWACKCWFFDLENSF